MLKKVSRLLRTDSAFYTLHNRSAMGTKGLTSASMTKTRTRLVRLVVVRLVVVRLVVVVVGLVVVVVLLVVVGAEIGASPWVNYTGSFKFM